jgi:hypothetical protein
VAQNGAAHSTQREWPHGGEEFAPDVQQARLGAKPAKTDEQPHGGKGPHMEGPAAGKDSQLHGAKAVQGQQMAQDRSTTEGTHC